MALKISPRAKVDTLFTMYRSTFYIDAKVIDSLAQETLKYAQSIKYPRGEAIMLIALGLTQENLGNLKEAIQYAQKAKAILYQHKLEKDLPAAHTLLGKCYRRKKLTDKAMQEYLKGLAFAEKLNDSRSVRLLNTSIAILQVGEKNYDKALLYHQKALSISRATKDLRGQQMCYSNIGIVYSRKKQYKKASQYHQQALLKAKELSDSSLIAFSYNDLGSTSLLLQQYPEAISYLKKSIVIRENINEMIEIAYTYNYLGQAYKKLGNLPEAAKWIKKALSIAKLTGNTKQEQEAYEELYLAYAYFKQYDSAYVYSRKYHLFSDSITQIANNEASNELLVSYETEKKDQQLKTLRYKNKAQELTLKQRQYIMIGLIIFVLLILLVAYLFYNRNKLKKNQRELEMIREIQSEKERIARDLHDNVGGQLSYIIYSLDGINNEDEETRSEVTESINQSVRSVIGSLRETIWAISDANIKISDLSDKLKVFAKTLFKHTQTKVVFNENLTEERELNALLALNLYRICQEVLNNAFKYAQASHIEVGFFSENEKLTITLADDGVGFDQQAETSKERYGLLNIKKRAGEFGIGLTLNTQYGKGTIYNLKV